MRNRFAMWKQKLISFGGRICLIQSVLSALPLFYLSFFRVPPCVVKVCNRLMRDFLWGTSDGGRRIAWVKWIDICQPKNVGGLGIKDIDLFNRSLLGKWLWRWRTEKNALWCRVINAKYEADPCAKVSPWWRSIQEASCFDEVDWFQEGVQKFVRGGDSTKFWVENWSGAGVLRELFPRLFNLSRLKQQNISDCGH